MQILSPEQLTNFLNAVDRDFLPFFALSAFSGLRREEIIRLDWNEVKLDRSLIDLSFAKSKNRRRKLIEVTGNLKQWLSPFARESGSVMPRKKLQLAFFRSPSELPCALSKSCGLDLVLRETSAGVRQA